MAADILGKHYTRIFNSAARDKRLSRRARGLLLEIMSHTEGFGISVKSLVASGPEGKAAINAGLRELEDHGYLNRYRPRNDRGQLGQAVYRVTDMPDGMIITVDPPWQGKQTRRSEPKSENQQQADGEQTRRSESCDPQTCRSGPKSDFPAQGNQPHKKTKPVEDQPAEDHSVRPSVVDAGARENGTDGRTDDDAGSRKQDKPRSSRKPAAPAAPVADNEGVALLLAIGAERPAFLLTGPPLEHQGLKVIDLLAKGWTPEQIRQVVAGQPLPDQIETTVGAIISARLTRADLGPVPRASAAPTARDGEHEYAAYPDTAETPVPAAYSEVAERLRAGVSAGSGRFRDCAGDGVLCPDGRLAEPGRDLCAGCLGWPVCECGVRRVDPGLGEVCVRCAEEGAEIRRTLAASGLVPVQPSAPF